MTQWEQMSDLNKICTKEEVALGIEKAGCTECLLSSFCSNYPDNYAECITVIRIWLDSEVSKDDR